MDLILLFFKDNIYLQGLNYFKKKMECRIGPKLETGIGEDGSSEPRTYYWVRGLTVSIKKDS